MRKITTTVSLVFICLLSATGTILAATFTDTASNKYENAIDYIKEKGIVQGYSDGTYKPDSKINRAELLKIILESNSVDTNDNLSFCFSDVKNDWYAKYVCKAKNLGIISGYSDGSFKPGNNINFVEALKIIEEAYGADIIESSVWYKGYVDEASSKNMIPLDIKAFNQEITRGQMADIITRYLKYKDGAQAEYLLSSFGSDGGKVITYEDIVAFDKNDQSSVGDQPFKEDGGSAYSLEQAMSDNAQLSTIAFDGLAFITGSAGADTFFPPGKVADFFGFQYMRDVDTAGYGHNTTFLSRVANNVLYILNDEQKAKLVALAKEQAPIYTNFAYNRFPLMDAFRRNLEGDIPTGSLGLSSSVVSAYTSNLYKLDADLSYNRALVVGEIINSFTDDQKAYLAKMEFDDYSSWPDVPEDETFKKSMTNTEFVAVMTYSSELFSWYKGSITADIYFCPERHGTYFGGFYMKDYPAMNNPDYFISTSVTGDSGQGFLDALNTTQKALITGIISEQESALTEIAQIRTTVSTELRKAMAGEPVDKEKVYTLIERYGELDGELSALYASRFAEVNETLTDAQRATLIKLRNLTVVPQGAYMFSTPTAMPEILSTDYMFGVGTMPSTAGQTSAPTGFGVETSK